MKGLTMKVNLKKENVENKKPNFVYIKIHKDDIVASNKESLLIKTPKNPILDDLSALFWVKKAFVFTDNFTNILTISISIKEGFKYNVFNSERKNIDWKAPDVEIEGKEFATILKEIFSEYNANKY